MSRLGWIAALVAVDYACVMLAVLADLRSGILKARRLKEKRTSGGLRRSVEKAGRYYVLLFAMTLIDVMVCGALLLLLPLVVCWAGLALVFSREKRLSARSAVCGALLFLAASDGPSLPPLPLFTTLCAIGLALIELKSIYENSHEKDDYDRIIGQLRKLLDDPAVVKRMLELAGIRKSD